MNYVLRKRIMNVPMNIVLLLIVSHETILYYSFECSIWNKILMLNVSRETKTMMIVYDGLV